MVLQNLKNFIKKKEVGFLLIALCSNVYMAMTTAII